MNRKATYTRDELMERYPDLAKAMDALIESDKKRFQSVWINYCGRYTRANGQTRRIELGQVIELLEAHGYKVDIGVSVA